MLRTHLFFPCCSHTSSSSFSSHYLFPIPLFSSPKSTTSSFQNRYHQLQLQLQLKKHRNRNNKLLASTTGGTGYEIGGGYPEEEELSARDRNGSSHNSNLDSDSDIPAEREALLKGGEQVISVLQEMVMLLEDMNVDEESEKVVVELAAQGVIGKRVDQMESDFMLALDYMIQLAEKDQDDKRKSLLEVIKETVLSHLTKKCPPHVQVIGLLCRTPQKESRHELLRRVAAGGGVFKGKDELKIHIPGANLNDIANQADDLLESMETRPVVPDRRLLARLVLIREEARDMMGGGILDERNNRGLYTLPEPEVNFLAKLVALKPGKPVLDMIRNVMQGNDEGAENLDEDENGTTQEGASNGTAGTGSVTGRKLLPVRPGMFLETVTKVLSGIYSGTESGITAQHLEWVHRKTLQVLQEIAFN